MHLLICQACFMVHIYNKYCASPQKMQSASMPALVGRRNKIRCEEAWAGFVHWILEDQFGHLGEVTLAMEEHPTNGCLEPTEAQYLAYFAFLRERQGSHRLWRAYIMLNKSHEKKFGQGINQWPNIHQSLQQYEYEEKQRRRGYY